MKNLVDHRIHVKEEQYLPLPGQPEKPLMHQYLLSLDIKALEALYIKKTNGLKLKKYLEADAGKMF